jgi:hypothetical protein
MSMDECKYLCSHYLQEYRSTFYKRQGMYDGMLLRYMSQDHVFDLYERRTPGILTISSQGVTTFWNDISARKPVSAMTAIKLKYCNSLQLQSDL